VPEPSTHSRRCKTSAFSAISFNRQSRRIDRITHRRWEHARADTGSRHGSIADASADRIAGGSL